MFLSNPIPSQAEDSFGVSVLIPPFYEIFWSAVILLGLWFVIRATLPKIYAMLDDRRDKIDEGLQAAQTAKEAAAAARRERDETLRVAAEEAKGIRDQAAADAKRIVSQAQQEAHSEAERIRATATKKLDAERAAAQAALRQDVGGLATELAEKIVGEQLKDTALSQRVIDRFMDDLEADMATTNVGADA